MTEGAAGSLAKAHGAVQAGRGACSKRGKDLEKLRVVIDELVMGKQLAERYRDQPLAGGYKGSRECHLEPDWLLIYERTAEELVLIRTGTHADLFGR